MKIFLKIKLKTNEEFITKELTGLKVDNKIIYNDLNVTTTIILNENNILLTRENNEYKIILNFNNNQSNGEYYLKGYNKFDLNIKLNLIEIKKNFIKIKYELNDDDICFECHYEEV